MSTFLRGNFFFFFFLLIKHREKLPIIKVNMISALFESTILRKYFVNRAVISLFEFKCFPGIETVAKTIGAKFFIDISIAGSFKFLLQTWL